jgi:hypothetical protein
MTRQAIAAALVMSCWSLDAARAGLAPADELSASIDPQGVRMSWRVPKQDLAVRYYVDICRLEHGAWIRIFGTYVTQPPFTLRRPAPQATYAWRVLSVDAGNEQDFAPTPWQILRVPAPSR